MSGCKASCEEEAMGEEGERRGRGEKEERERRERGEGEEARYGFVHSRAANAVALANAPAQTEKVYF